MVGGYAKAQLKVFLLEQRKIFSTLDRLFDALKDDPDFAKVAAEVLRLESLKQITGHLPKNSSKLRSLFEYLLLELVQKLKEAARGDLHEDGKSLARDLGQDLASCKLLLK